MRVSTWRSEDHPYERCEGYGKRARFPSLRTYPDPKQPQRVGLAMPTWHQACYTRHMAKA